MRPPEFDRTLAIGKSLVDDLGFNPYYQPLIGLRHGRLEVNGHACFDLASNDYLGLASDGRVHEAMVTAIREYGSSMCGTPIATGYARILVELEQALSRFVGLEAAAVFPSCYQANCSLFAVVASPQDIIFVDHYVHASLARGIKAAGCKVRPFRHNDVEHLERQMAASTACRRRFVVTESVFSTEGSVAPLDAIVALCRQYEAIPVVDDSHGIGVLGARGRGILEAKDITDFDGIYTASLGKALANAGGMVAGGHAVIEALRYSCPGLIYSTALPPASVAGTLRVVEILTQEFDRRGGTMWTAHRRLVETLRRRRFELQPAAAPIAAIRCGSAENTLKLAKRFFEHRLLTTPFIPPAVPEDAGVVRLIVGAKLDEAGLQAVLQSLEDIGGDLRP
jgi:7-keto-8-aminopelargonate synthetase-like enzyme